MILYGVTAEQSIPRLFLAGIVPGLLLAGFMAAFILAHALLTGIKAEGGFSLARAARATLNCLWALGMPAIVFGGIYGGVFSPTEAAGIACVYAILVSLLVYRDIAPRELFRIAGNAMAMTAQIMVIVAAAGVFGWMLTTSGTPQAIVAWIGGLDLSPWQVLLAINILLLLVGCVIDPTSAILVLTPLLLPIILHAGVDPIHFGIIMTVNLSIGMFTPPFGLNLFVLQSMFRIPTVELYRGQISVGTGRLELSLLRLECRREIGRIEPGEHLAGNNAVANRDISLQQFAAHPKAESRLDAGTNFAGQAEDACAGGDLCHHRSNRTGRLGFRLGLLALAGHQQKKRGNRRRQQSQAHQRSIKRRQINN